MQNMSQKRSVETPLWGVNAFLTLQQINLYRKKRNHLTFRANANF